MAVHIPGVENVEADKKSRQSHSQLEWTLDRTVFRDCLNVVKLVPNIDLFAYFQTKPPASALCILAS